MSNNKLNVRDLEVDLGLEGQDIRYNVQAPNNSGGAHHTITTGVQGEHYSFDTDENGDVVEGSGHYTGPEPKEGEDRVRKSFDPPAQTKHGVRVKFNPFCLWD